MRAQPRWWEWVGYAVAAAMLLVFPVGTVMGLLLLFAVRVSRPERRPAKAYMLPLVFLIVAVPLAVFIIRGAGTEMSPLMLYPLATPWWLFFPDVPGTETRSLLIACGLNTALLACAGVLWDRRARRH